MVARAHGPDDIARVFVALGGDALGERNCGDAPRLSTRDSERPAPVGIDGGVEDELADLRRLATARLTRDYEAVASVERCEHFALRAPRRQLRAPLEKLAPTCIHRIT